ncbi:MAG: maltotransferase domain-containing protein [Gammaproteobacteria bacterium]
MIQSAIRYSGVVNARNNVSSGPRVFHLCARHAGPIADWGEWLEQAQNLGCDWLWLDGLQPREAGTHRCAVSAPGKLARELAPGSKAPAALEKFVAAAHAQHLKLVMDFAPACVARTSALIKKQPQWFVAGPDGTPGIPDGMGDPQLAATLAACDFDGPAGSALTTFWAGIAEGWLACGFDALICRAAHRMSPQTWRGVLSGARRKEPAALFWADTLGAPIEASEALASVGFDAFFSSACWWDFHAVWFLEQEARLRRLAPTIALAAPPDAPVEESERRARFRYGFAATTAWGVVLPRTRREPNVTGNSKVATRIAAINALKRDTPTFNEPGRVRRLSAPGARAVVLAMEPAADTTPTVLFALNPDPTRHAEVHAGELFARLDARTAQARELTPGRTPQPLGADSEIALEPGELRWFELTTAEPGTQAEPIAAASEPNVAIAIEDVAPQIEAGRYPVKRILGAAVNVEADLIAEGHARPAAALSYRACSEETWRETTFEFFDNDRWRGRFVPDAIGLWTFQVLTWRDRFGDWRSETIKRRDAGQPLAPELGEGEALLKEAMATAGKDRTQKRLKEIATLLGEHTDDAAARADILLAHTTAELIARTLPRAGLTASAEFSVQVERARARTGAWYECFPRSLGESGHHGTFDDLILHMPYIAGLGFDVVYLPPIHPIGTSHRKGKNNALDAGANDPGSPWAIGSKQGGHTAIHSELGTLDDFHRVLAAARREGLEIALDFAIQCSPDHPWVKEHPEWFRWRPDGSIRYAENPPKKYQDIVNVDFFCVEHETLWRELLDVLLYWCEQGVRIFRVDNPHTKALGFWEWAFSAVQARYPETIFLAEAFTRPKLMHRLAKLGFSQSYTYFTWRESKAELTEYLIELTTGDSPQYFRPNFWVNTPDINPFNLHHSGRAGFVIRATLAATLVPSWGMYSGYELCEAAPLLNEDGSEREEYLDSEKYELKSRNFDAPGNIHGEIATLNRIRHENPAFDELTNLRFHNAYNDQVLFYSKHSRDNLIWVLVSLDPQQAQEADIELPLEMLDADEGTTIAVEDLFRCESWHWHGRHQRVRLDPTHPAMILRVGRTGP